MFTIEQIHRAHNKVKSGADFPKYIQEIKSLGVIAFETWVKDSHTEYFGLNSFKIASKPMYEDMAIANTSNEELFKEDLKTHQQGKTDYLTFCKDCAKSGIEKWFVSLTDRTCTYYDKSGKIILVELIPE